MRKIDLNQERVFENEKQINTNIRNSQKKFYWAVQIPTDKHNNNSCKKIKGKNVLEIGCSKGDFANIYTKFCKTYLGLDISDEAIKIAKSLNLSNAKFICTDAHKLPVESNSIDFVIVNGLLHHLDLSKSLREIHRVINKDGYLIFREPLGTNPFFMLYRKLTPSARTPDEKPFDFNDINILKSYFYIDDLQYFGFFNVFSAYIRLKFIRKILTFFDYCLSKTPLKFFFWQFCGFAKKK